MNVRGPCWARSFFPSRYWAQVPPQRVQAVLQRYFQRWGRPRKMRVDNGYPWGSWSDLPSQLALWLIGLGVQMIWNPPGQPQCNGVVERSQGTAKRWAEPLTCRSVRTLQKRLNRVDYLQREKYPLAKGQSRLAMYPTLRNCRRRYTMNWEKKHWSLSLILTHLSSYAVTRRVDSSGQVRLYNRHYYVGSRHVGKWVYVSFDPQQRAWIFSDKQGRQLRTCPSREINREQIVKLKVLHHDASRPAPSNSGP
jgi:hypothetical protein